MSTYFNGENVDENFNKDNSSINPFTRLITYYNALFDKIQFYFCERWLAVGALALFYTIRLLLTKGKFNFLFFRLSCCHLLPWNTYP